MHHQVPTSGSNTLSGYLFFIVAFALFFFACSCTSAIFFLTFDYSPSKASLSLKSLLFSEHQSYEHNNKHRGWTYPESAAAHILNYYYGNRRSWWANRVLLYRCAAGSNLVFCRLAIHVFRGHSAYEHFDIGTFYVYYGVPDAWGFLMFCAGWTFLGVFFLLIARVRYADHALAGYFRLVVEAIAFLSWLAGFIAVAVNIGSHQCPAEENGCGPLMAATVFGAFEWLLFLFTMIITMDLVFNDIRWPRNSKSGSAKPAV